MSVPYPSREEATEGWTDKDYAEAVTNLTSYYTQPHVIVEFTPRGNETPPEVLYAWAYLTESLCASNPNYVAEGFRVVIPLTAEELHEAAAGKAAADLYQERTAEAKRIEDAEAEANKPPF
jgi:hypothetical protein